MTEYKKAIIAMTMSISTLLCLILFTPWIAGCAYLKPLPSTIETQVNDSTNYKIDGIIVYVDERGKPPKFYTAGWNNRANKTPANPHLLFKIASISKLYIATAAAKLIADNHLALDKPLTFYLPEFSKSIEYADQITLKMLLQHRSGIPNFIDNPNYPWENLPKTTNEVLSFGLNQKANFKPDEKYQYSNTNYVLIGLIMDKALGYSHEKYIQTNVIDPLGLTNTYTSQAAVDPNRLMSGYYIGYLPDLKNSVHIAAGGSMIASAQDVGIFLRALNDGSLLSKKEQEIYSSVYVFDHTGLLPGYSSIAKYHKDIDTVVVQFVNTSGGNSWLLSEIIYNRILKIIRKNSTK